MQPAAPLDLDKEFIADCLAIKVAGHQPPIWPTDTLVSDEKMATDDVVSKKTRLVDNYPQAYSDFYPSRAHCVYKSGPVWPVRNGPGTPWRGVQREVRPVHAHAIGTAWLSIGKRIYEYLDSARVKWTSINPLAYANAGDAKPFCPLVITIGVKPNSLLYEAAITASTAVKEILAGGGFPDIEVAFVESVVTRSVAGPKLLSFSPFLDDVPDLRKPFTTALGLSIAPLQYPHFEGTAALYFRLNKDDNRTAILTCAHVARPPHVYRNTGMTRKSGQRREEVVALGSTGYSNAVKAMMSTIARLVSSIEIWNDARDRLGEPVEGENREVTERRQDYVDLVAKARRTIVEANAMHSEVTKHRSIPDLRVIGFVLHSEKIEVSVDPHGFTKDWALIELYDEKIDWATFKGNKVYVGTSFSIPLSLSLFFFISRLVFSFS